MRIIAESLTEKAFAPYGDLLAAPAEFGRAYFDEGLRTSRATAWPSLSVSHVRPLPSLPLEARVMERHEFSSQSFLPLDVARWLVVVAPAGADRRTDPPGPQVAQRRARGRQLRHELRGRLGAISAGR